MQLFCDKLRTTRLAKGLTQAQAADYFGWTPMYYGRYEKGQLLPTKVNYKKFSKFLDMDLDSFIRWISTLTDTD